jgi:hypothetical protein
MASLAEDLIDQARRAGLTVHLDGTQLVVRGPKSQEELARRLLANKLRLYDVLSVKAVQAVQAVQNVEIPEKKVLSKYKCNRLSLENWSW